MCTVTYVPVPESGYLLTSSRDETTTRPSAQFPVTSRVGGQTVCFPKDPQSSGTWVAASSRLTVCLLNGAFQAHIHRPPYRHSRGLVPLSVFAAPSPADWLTEYTFDNLEPFTLIVVESGDHQPTSQLPKRLWEVRWDGQTVHVQHPDPASPHIWSSSTLYSDYVIARRQHWFRDWLDHQPENNMTVAAIRAFHHQAGAGDDLNGVRMNRGNGLQTLSLTTVQQEQRQAGMYYEDFLTSTIGYHALLTTPAHEFAH